MNMPLQNMKDRLKKIGVATGEELIMIGMAV